MKVPVVVSELIDELRFPGFTVITWGRRSGFVVIWRRGSQRWSIAVVDNNNARLSMTIEMLRKEIGEGKGTKQKFGSFKK